MVDVVTGDTELSATKQDLIAALVLRELQASAVVAQSVMDVSSFAVPGSKSISFPKMTSFSVQKRTSSQPGDAQALTASVDQLNLNQNAYIAWIIEKFDNLQSQVAADLESLRRAASAHARGVDSDLIADMLANAKNSQTFSSAITRDNILDLRLDLDNENIPDDGNRFLLINPQEERDMLDIADFIDASKYGSSDPIQNGEIGRVYGLRVLKSNLITANQSLCYHREGLALGFQARANVGEQSAIEYGTGSKKMAMDQLYGYKVLQGGAYISKLV